MSQLTQSVWVYLKTCSGYPAFIGAQFSYDLAVNPSCVLYTDYKSASGGFVPLNQWAYLVMTYDGANTRLYINGQATAVSPNTGAIANALYPIYIGSWLGTTDWFNGLIDDVRVYNRALSAAEIQALYNAEK